MKIALTLLAALAAALPAQPASAQSASSFDKGSGGSGQAYPVRTVRIIVPYAAGGNTDITARAVGSKLADIFEIGRAHV